MSLTPSNVAWDANRYKATEYIIKYNTTGTPYLDKKEASYTNTNYNFAALPPKNPPTIGPVPPPVVNDPTTNTQQQTEKAFGEGIIPHYWKDKEDKPVYTDTTSDATEYNRDWLQSLNLTTGAKVEPTKAGNWRKNIKIPGTTTFSPDKSLIGKSKDFLKKGWENITQGIESSKKKFQIPMGFAGAILKAITKRPTILGSSAEHSFRGVANLYNKEIYLMNKYGSTGPTIHNPTGDTRKDDAGFNIVSWAGDYNVLGSWSRRHNMLKAADAKYAKNSKEWKAEREKIRSDWAVEKETGTENKKYNIDSSGTIPKAPKGIKGPAGGASTGGNYGGDSSGGHKLTGPKEDEGGQNQGGSTGHGDASKAGGESTSLGGSF